MGKENVVLILSGILAINKNEKKMKSRCIQENGWNWDSFVVWIGFLCFPFSLAPGRVII